MLEGLDDIPWSTLRHAYGSAADVPGQLRALLSDDPKVWQDAYNDLTSNIYHQGSVYEATPYAIPFLVELLRAANDRLKVEYLLFLVWMGNGNSWLDVHQHARWAFSEEQKQSAEHQERLHTELDWVRATKETVYRYHPLYIELLDSPDVEVRAYAAELLSAFPQYYDAFSPALFQALQREQDMIVQSSLLLSISWFAPAYHDPTLSQITPYLEEEFPLLTRWSAAIALTRLQGKEVPTRVLNFLVEILPQWESVEALAKRDQEFPGLRMNTLATTYITLSYIGRERLEPHILLLLKRIPDINHFYLERVAYALLWMVFYGAPMPEGYTVHDLDEVQYQMLNTIAEKGEWAWRKGDPSTEQVMVSLSSLNVPCVRRKLRAFLEARNKGIAND